MFPTYFLEKIFTHNLSLGNNDKMSRNKTLQSCFQRKYYWVPAVLLDVLICLPLVLTEVKGEFICLSLLI
jgi:hypothetical protein